MLKRISIVTLLILSQSIFAAGEKEKATSELAARKAMRYGIANNLKNIALAAYPDVADEDKEDLKDEIVKKFKIAADKMPPHKSELLLPGAIEKATKEVLTNHGDLLSKADVSCNWKGGSAGKK